MKGFTLRTLSLGLLLCGALLAAPAAQTLDADLQRVIQKEAVATDLKPIIEEYRKIVARAGGNRGIAAKALLRIADCYQRIGDVESTKVLEQIVRDFADQKEAADEARTRLGSARSAAAATGPLARQLWDAADILGSPSADGRLLSYTDWDTGDLAIRDLTTNTSRRVTNTGGWMASSDFAEYSLMSPDGRQVAVGWYTAKAPLPEAYSLRVLSTDPANRGVIDLARGPWFRPAAWLPDGKSIVAVRQVAAMPNQQSELILFSLADRSARPLKTLAVAPEHVTVSPDGRFVAYDTVMTAGGQRHIRVLTLASGAERQLLELSAADRSPYWTPDGTRILFLSDRTGRTALWSIAVANGLAAGTPELFSADVNSPMGITSTGTLLYSKGERHRNVYVVGLTSDMKAPGAPVPVTEQAVDTNRSGAWSPDGQRIAFYTDRGVHPPAVLVSLVVRTVASGEERDIPLRLHVPPATFSTIRWFPDGRSVLVPSQPRDASEVQPGFYRVDLATGAAERLIDADTPRGVDITPDGGTILYINRSDLYRFDVKTRTSTKVTLASWYGAVAIAPDGSAFAYLGNPDGVDSRRNQIVVAPLSGGPGRALYKSDEWYDGTRFNSITWSRDSGFVFFVRADGQREVLWRVPVNGGPAERTGVSVAANIKTPAAHPDGKRLAFTALGGSNEIWALEGLLRPRPRPRS